MTIVQQPGGHQRTVVGLRSSAAKQTTSWALPGECGPIQLRRLAAQHHTLERRAGAGDRADRRRRLRRACRSPSGISVGSRSRGSTSSLTLLSPKTNLEDGACGASGWSARSPCRRGSARRPRPSRRRARSARRDRAAAPCAGWPSTPSGMRGLQLRGRRDVARDHLLQDLGGGLRPEEPLAASASRRARRPG